MQYSFTFLAFAVVVQANPVANPQAVTAAISPSAAPPPGCTSAFSGSFGIAVQNVSTSAVAKRQEAATQTSDGRIQAQTYAAVSMITDGQVQGSMHTMVVLPVAQIADGQVQAQTTMVAPVTQILDGQPQAPTIVPSTSTAAAVSQISDAQIQAPTTEAAPAPTVTETAVSQATDAQVSVATSSSSAALGSPSSSGGAQMVACATENSLALTLDNGVLKDAKGRTGYIASNFQFQFDEPPQAGAIYTSGFTTCPNGTLALGGSNVFYQCLSGDFYNLYDRSWAAQCSPVTISTVKLVTCS